MEPACTRVVQANTHQAHWNGYCCGEIVCQTRSGNYADTRILDLKGTGHGTVEQGIRLKREDGSYSKDEEQHTLLLLETHFPDIKPDDQWKDDLVL